jgi:hypothetical protein
MRLRFTIRDLLGLTVVAAHLRGRPGISLPRATSAANCTGAILVAKQNGRPFNSDRPLAKVTPLSGKSRLFNCYEKCYGDSG